MHVTVERGVHACMCAESIVYIVDMWLCMICKVGCQDIWGG